MQQSPASIQFEILEPGTLSMQLYASNGELIAQPIDNQLYQSGRYILDISTTGLAPGEYFLVLRDGALSEMQRLVVMK